MNIILFDTETSRKKLKPFTLTRPISELKIGALTITEKWTKKCPGHQISILSSLYLMEKYEFVQEEDNLFVSGTILPCSNFIDEVLALKVGEAVTLDDEIIAFRSSSFMSVYEVKKHALKTSVTSIKKAWHILENIPSEIVNDLALLNFEDYNIDDPHTVVYGNQLFVGKDVTIRNASINTLSGPVIIDDGATISEFSVITGPAIIGKNSTITAGAAIRQNTVIGDNCIVGGEVKDSLIMNNTNKSHSGYLGSSIIGEWCNFGAGTNVSNLKNNLSTVNVWDFEKHEYSDSGQLKLGLLMGDYSMTAIGTQFKTGSTVGVSANILSKEPAAYVPSFTWNENEKYIFDKVVTKSQTFARLKGQVLSDTDILILEYICTS